MVIPKRLLRKLIDIIKFYIDNSSSQQGYHKEQLTVLKKAKVILEQGT